MLEQHGSVYIQERVKAKNNMLGSLSLPSVSYSFDSDGTAIVPVTAGKGKNKLGKIEIQSPLVQMSEFFSGH